MNITLKNLHESTEQQVFYQVANHLLTQERKSTHVSGHPCVYRSPDGLKCAAGCLISDDEYNETMESRSWEGLFNLGIVPEYHKFLIWSLQKIHDEIKPEFWKIRLKQLAIEHNLQFKF